MTDIDLYQTALLKYLQIKSPVYYGKISEIKESVSRWLSYITNTFPHYTQHTLEHSIEMIRQLSLLLFVDNNPEKPVIKNLFPTEAYILVTSAFLHDAGMVASDREKSEIIMSETWRDWTTGQGGGAKRWLQVQQFLKGNNPEDETLRIFLYDLQTRFLLAEFIRKSHHLRTGHAIKIHEESLGHFSLDDPALGRAISDVCVAHGLKKHELEDTERFPDRRDIHGDIVNLQLMAILLRIADLLDISYDRACPLLLNAAAPLPADSMVHWTQYQRITHRMTAPDKIQITAECQNQNEHRYLRDWFQWLEDEISNAIVLAAHWNRHNEWMPPTAILNGKNQTIKIRPAQGSTYIFEDWKLELDIDTIFERLIYQVNPDSSDFIRELIQNALDASRCRMYLDFIAAGEKPPEFPTQFPKEWRDKYPIQINLEEQEYRTELSGEFGKRQVLMIEDFGVGMDREIIQRYFLQIGRSYYTTDEFRRKFRFIPTSRFGLGFLSVFAVSDSISIETYKPESEDSSLWLTLKGPRNYLLIEKGQRAYSGTKIEIMIMSLALRK